MRRRAVLCLVVLAVAVPVMAEDHPCADRAKNEVVQFMALTAEQVTAWDGLLAARQQAVPPLREQLQGVEDQIKTLLEQPSPDPGAVGALVLQARGLRNQIEAANKTYLDGFEGALSADQKVKLGFLRRADGAEPLFPSFRLFGLIPRFDRDWWRGPETP